ncbi:HAMP domain-containing histidine kinase [Photobacterium sp. GJ3]|uniref:sensor histidine kinase n=1 Tax=Photobacterium sp. GJ3 TaxID=2829502 RepID=UPI001B8C3927|nr:HAMP domain-containing sensor histidine kinase [Photobacterium sp. GJ3]QUJ66349.1 HAMP domain-containing histidine kinase [Photobacterium sp. GJ3]
MVKATGSKVKQTFPSIYRKLRLSFVLLTLAMFGLFWSVIYIAENQLEIISLHHWLDTEANRYASDYPQLGIATPLPNPTEFSSYWSEADLPDWLASYTEPGFYEHLLGIEDKHFTVIHHPSGQGLFYIVFQDDADDYLDGYEANLHHITLILGAAMTLAMILYGVYLVRTLSQPLARIQQKISRMPPDQPLFEVDTAFQETRAIEQSLRDSKLNIARYFQREQDFSRFASHELRTPIMVIKGSADILQKVPDQPRIAVKAICRLQQASQEMTLLTETFLLLGREHIDRSFYAACPLADILQHQLEELSPLFARQDTSYHLTLSHPGTIKAPESFVSIIINNLIKNAFSYSIDAIQISLNANHLMIANRHDGKETDNAGYGCGLVIVERICERMNWRYTVHDDGQTFTTSLVFS